ncbi:uncharacterized protein [Amphiura filiformis]|uniref:uncharacterized protein n=1 Tax=Amphiura filiformis TaxID=82378 RepID=UPI003B22801C
MDSFQLAIRWLCILVLVANSQAQSSTFQVSVNPTTVDESVGSQVVTVTVRRTSCNGVCPGTQDVVLSTRDGTATAAQDYTANTNQVTFTQNPEDQSQTFTVTILNDNVYEPGNPETFYVYIVTVDSNAYTNTDVPIMITDDDAEIAFETGAYSVREGDDCTCNGGTKGVCVKLTRTGNVGREAVIQLVTDVTGFTATPTDDFVELVNTVDITFAVDDTERKYAS